MTISLVQMERMDLKDQNGFLMVTTGPKRGRGAYGAFLPDVPGFFVVGSTIKEIEKETAKSLPAYLNYLKQEGKDPKPTRRTKHQTAQILPSSFPNDASRCKCIRV